jgi:hypothetical protein
MAVENPFVSIFPAANAEEKAALAAKVRGRFRGASVLENLSSLSDDDIIDKLHAAERYVSRRLRLDLTPTWVVPEGITDAEIGALTGGEMPWRMEPGYDYHGDFFRGNEWGFLKTRSRPIIEVKSYRFTYADPSISLFEVPQSWLRVDAKYGTIRLLPTGQAGAVPLNTYLLSVFGGSRVIPHMIRVTYLAGIDATQDWYMDLVDFIYRVAGALLLRDSFPASSASIATDGLSQSRGFDLKNYVGGDGSILEDEFRRWHDDLNGPRLIAV